MEDIEVKQFGIVGMLFRCAGTCVGTAAFAGKKITGLMAGSLAAAGHLLARPIEPSEFVTDERTEYTPGIFALKPKPRKTAVNQYALKDRVAALKSDLAEARDQLTQAQNQVGKAQSQFVSQLQAQQTENKSLISELEQALRKAEEATARVSAAKVHVAALESDLAEARRQLEKTKSQAEQAQAQFALQLENLQTERDSLLSELAQARNEVNETKARQDAARAHVAALESELAAAKCNLEEARKFEKDIKSGLSSDIEFVQPCAKIRLGDWGKEKIAPAIIKNEITPLVETTVAEPDNGENVNIKEYLSKPVIAEDRVSIPVGVTAEQVQTASFESETERILFARALSDITSPDTSARIDAVRAMADIRHKFSVRAIDAQMASEPSAMVRQECIKALTSLGIKEGAGAIERALTDEAASVRLAAVWGLYRLSGIQSSPALIRMLDDKDEGVRQRVITCIGWLGKEELAVELLPLLDDSSVSIRQAVVEAMGKLRCRQTIPSLIKRLNDPDKTIRKAILDVLKTITGKKMSGPSPRDEKSFLLLVARWQQWWKDEKD